MTAMRPVWIAVPSGKQRTMKECTCCREYADEGYFLQRDLSVQFVCEDCYGQNFCKKYPIAENVIRIPGTSLGELLEGTGRNDLKAGYLLGKQTREEDSGNDIVTVNVTELLPVLKEGNGHITYFSNEDFRNIKEHLVGREIKLVGLYRTSPSGECTFNSLDEALAKDLKKDLVYLVIAGKKQGMISGMSGALTPDKTGIVIV